MWSHAADAITVQSRVSIVAAIAWAASAVLGRRMLGGWIDVRNLGVWKLLFGTVRVASIAALKPSQHIAWTEESTVAPRLRRASCLGTGLAALAERSQAPPRPPSQLGTPMMLVIGIVASVVMLQECPRSGGPGITLILLSLMPGGLPA
jgi:hypothetical protein